MTPTLGQGANMAIENAASLSNYIAAVTKQTPMLSMEEVNLCLGTWAASRKPRTMAICLAPNALTRLESFATLPYRLIGIYILPHLGRWFADLASLIIIGAECLDFLPIPKRSLTSIISFENAPIEILAKTQYTKAIIDTRLRLSFTFAPLDYL